MSLLSLKKSQPSTKLRIHSADEFIDNAVHYAFGHPGGNGGKATPSFDAVATGSPPPRTPPNQVKNTAMKHATFTLSPESIDKLAHISELTGISRSRLIRIWIDSHPLQNTELLLSSSVL